MLAATSNEDLGAVEMQIRWGLPGTCPPQWSLSCFTAPPDDWQQPLGSPAVPPAPQLAPACSLMAYTKVVLKRVYDDVALGVRLLLVEEVG
jgi:hypothetical protein